MDYNSRTRPTRFGLYNFEEVRKIRGQKLSLPSMFTCKGCGLSLRPGDNTVERKATVWLKGNGKTVNRVVEEMYEYKHVFCSEIKMPENNSLF